MKRRDFIAAGAAGAAALAATSSPGKADRPNILWLVSEDNSPYLGCYGDQKARTPNLDRLASQCIMFTNAFANAPVCAPARNTLHTGMYASCLGTEHMRSDYPLPTDIKFFTHYLRDSGYNCINGAKTDYNTNGTPSGAWDSRKFAASLAGLEKNQPFFRFINYMTTHESCLHAGYRPSRDLAEFDPAPYHPDTPAVRRDYAVYYDMMEKLDGQIGEILEELDERGLAEDTIVFYFSDNGGALPGSKRQLNDRGMRVPLIVRFPPKYRHLAPSGAGTRCDRLVSFVDFAPTMLSLAGLPVPPNMQGSRFMGVETDGEPDCVYGFRGRMDERYDLSRAVVDKRFRYIRNYFPHLPWGRHLDYQWKAPSMQSWEEEYRTGRLNEIQARFFGLKPVEELYELAVDPHEINNLAENPEYHETLFRMRDLNRRFIIANQDLGFLHEIETGSRAAGGPPRLIANYRVEEVLQAAEFAGERRAENIEELKRMLLDSDSGVRYWAAVGCSALGEEAGPAEAELVRATEDDSWAVRIAAAEALGRIGRSDIALRLFAWAMAQPNPYVGCYASDALYNTGLTPDPGLKFLARRIKRRMNLHISLNAIR